VDLPLPMLPSTVTYKPPITYVEQITASTIKITSIGSLIYNLTQHKLYK